MANYTIILVLLGLMVLLNVVAEKIRIAPPIVLIIAGIAIGFIPSMPVPEMDPEVIFLLFLPPLLYDAAFNIHFKDFRENMGTISALAIGLVFLTTAGVAVLSYYLVPGMTWPLAFVLGAILAATDAVAAISITRNLGLPRHTVTILEGESLINDASALVAYRFAVAAVMGSAFVWWKASLTFILLMAGGFLVGLVLGKLLAVVLRYVRKSTMAVLGFTLLAPFTAYLVAEETGVSGVIAVVVLGFGVSMLSERQFSASLRLQSKTIWDVVVYLLNGLIFIFIGLEFPVVIRAIDPSRFLPYIGYAFLITMVTILIRMMRVFAQRRRLEKGFRNSRMQNSRRAIRESALLSFQESVIISWSGMRGIVSLAIALGLPPRLEDGSPFPMRNDIIFIATVVVIITILGQGLLLPGIVKRVTGKDNGQ
ncbi:Na+/H+ antiporter [Niabella drilacis]|uniref:Monovalent cation:H+ antiporter, CPA1 family n=1 Tax=Niabella drilacis (strain DSM 25811 / CCM 8410 / CCUG 62505 / LMG 26954 / E90) TaxID=1285928 RepID=A0A1G6S0D4_NIADE|nr:Na+/H+ antiporter [Niabella drilacis]SDD10288.1 monovalent cation:H+ antiporter, CPA1 family [Niabella drilacis]